MDDQDYIEAHGCKTGDEYDTLRFNEWVEAMESSFGQTEGVVGRENGASANDSSNQNMVKVLKSA